MVRVREAVARYDTQALAADLAALLAFSAGIALTVGIIKTPMRLPGHSAVFWIPVLLLAGCRRAGMPFGSALLGGAFGCLWGFVKPHEMGAVMAAAAVVEALGLHQARRGQAALMLVAGVIGNLGKLGLKAITLGVASTPLNHAGLTLMPTLALYAAFGLIGGIVAVLLLTGWRKVRGTAPGLGS